MSNSDPSLSLRARFVFPVSAPPIPNGVVTISGGRIVGVERASASSTARDIGDVAIIPGLVNAHTHLEFTDLETPLGTSGMTLPDWIRHVLAHRRAAPETSDARIARGLAESLGAGSTTVGEIATHDWRGAVNLAGAHRPAVVVFHESIAPTPDRLPGAKAAAEAFLGTGFQTARGVWPGLSPHAPYTARRELVESLAALSEQSQVPMAMHLAESREELELLESRGGAFRTLLKDLDAWDPRPGARYPRIIDYLRQLARAPRSLVIHGNYLSTEDIGFLSAHAETMTVVYCPRTHFFFRHARYPLAAMLAAGVAAALGTDSRASNPDLSLFEEMRFVAEHHAIPPQTVLRLGTLAGARALGLEGPLGTLEAGKLANLVIVQLANTSTSDPHELLFTREARVAQTWFRGRPVE